MSQESARPSFSMPHAAVILMPPFVASLRTQFSVLISSEYDSLLRGGFTDAFRNANDAQSALAENPLDPEIGEVAGWLFGASTNYAIAQARLQNVGNIPKDFTYDSMAIFGNFPTFPFLCVYILKEK